MYQRRRKFPCLRSQRRAVLYANTHVCASEIGRFSFIAKRHLWFRNLTLYFFFSFIEMSFGKCCQKNPPDFPSLRVRAPSKSYGTPLVPCKMDIIRLNRLWTMRMRKFHLLVSMSTSTYRIESNLKLTVTAQHMRNCKCPVPRYT